MISQPACRSRAPSLAHPGRQCRSNARRWPGILLGACLSLAGSPGQAADCFQEAADFHQVDADILRAIAKVESAFDQHAVGRNSNGSEDIGMMQINSVHFPALARQGITPQRLLDACTSIYVAAWHYARQIRRYGDTWHAVGAYHSATPALRDGYARRVREVLEGWRAGGRVEAVQVPPLYSGRQAISLRPDNYEFRWLDE